MMISALDADSCMKFFKSMRRQYAVDFLVSGRLRIGSLYDFRKIESYGDEVGDKGEGTKDLYTDQRHITEQTIPEFLSDRIRVETGNRLDIIMDGDGLVSARFQDPNLYLFCVSTDFDAERIRRLEHDACLVIEDIMFFQHLHNAMRPHIAPNTKGLLGEVLYGTRRHFHEHDPKLPMALVKPERFRYQREARALWIPRPDLSVEPFLYVHAPLAIDSCRREPLLI
jgi:hypothetical protein